MKKLSNRAQKIYDSVVYPKKRTWLEFFGDVLTSCLGIIIGGFLGIIIVITSIKVLS